MFKKSLLLMLLMALLAPWAANAQSLFSEDFEGGAVPEGWTQEIISGTVNWTVQTGDYAATTGAGQGTYNALFKASNRTSQTRLITPEIDLSSVTSASLSFMHIQRSWGGDIDQLRVYYRASSEDEWTLLPGQEYTSAVASWTTEDEIVLPNTSSTYQLAFEGKSNWGYGVGLDAIVITPPASCTKPTMNETVTSTQTSATLSWTENGSATSWVLQYSTDATFATASSVNVSGTPSKTITGLTPSTNYFARVKAVCSSTDESDFSAAISFYTQCGAVTTFPWSDDFESYEIGDFTNPCWVNEHIEGNGTYIFKIYSSSYISNSTQVLQLPDMSAGTMTKLVLPEMTLPGDNYMFSLDIYRNTSSYATEGIRVFVSTNGEIEGATELAFISRNYTESNGIIPAESATGWYSYDIPLPIRGTAYIILRGESQYGSSTYMDNFSVTEMPSCIKPTGLVVSDVAGHSAKLSWTSEASAWVVAYKKTADDDFTETPATTNPFILSGLAPETAYTVKVRANCGGTYSDWTDTKSFTTTVACPAPTGLAATLDDDDNTKATLSWTAGDASDWVLQYGTTSDYAGATEVEVNTTPSVALTGLTSGTKYYARVKAVCGGDDGESTWATTTFTTRCDTKVVDKMHPLSEGFEDSSFPPVCWDRIASGTRNWTRSTTHHEGAASAYSGYYGDIYLVLPTIELANDATDVTLTFWSYNTYTGDYDKNSVVLLNGGEETELWSPASVTQEWVETNIDLSAYKGQTITLAFKYEGNNAHGWYVDDVEVAFGATCPKPTALTNGTPTNHTVELSWTAGGEEEAWQIIYKDAREEEYDETQVIDVTENPYVLRGLTPEATYNAMVRAICGSDDMSAWSNEITFTMDVACPAPSNLNVANITSNSAVISWEGEGTYELRYGVVENSSKGTLFYDFEDGLGDWTTIDGDGDGFTWTLVSEIENITTSYSSHDWGVDGSDAVFSGSYVNGASWITTTPDNLLVSPMVTLGGSISFYAKNLQNDYPEHIGVCVSTTNNTTVSAFTVIQEWDVDDTDEEYHEYTVDLSAYSGQGYIAIRNFNVEDMYIVLVDNVTIVEGAVGGEITWSDPITVTSPYSLTGLTPETNYLVQVRANCGEDGTSDWQQRGFKTKGLCDAPTALTATDVDASSATLGWTGVQNSYNVQYRTAEYKEEFFFTDFDEGVPTGWTNQGGHYYWTGTSDYWVFLGYTAAGTQNLITSDLSEYEGASTIEFKQRYYGSAMSFKYGFSSTTTEMDAFDWSDDVAATSSETLYSVRIPDGAKYFGIQATSETAETQGIIIDDFGIYGPTVAAGTWVSADNVTSPYTISGLQAKTKYEWQVRGKNSSCDDGYGDWSEKATFTTEPSCLVPTNLTVRDITTESAVLAWESDATLFDIELNGRMFAEDVTNPYTLDLEPGTTYTVKVRAHCGGDDYSDWTSSISFMTKCNAFDLPYEYGFDDLATSENPEYNCWIGQSFNTANGVGFSYRDEEAGDVMFRFSSYNSASDYRQILVSPELNTTEAVKVEFEYRAHNSSTEKFKVGYASTLNLEAFEWEDTTSVSGTDWHTYSTVVPAGTKYVAVLYISSYQYYLYLDNFSFTEVLPITQTTTLVGGGAWNRFGLSIEVEDPIAMLQALQEQLGDAGLIIETSNGANENYGDGFWFGDLDEVGISNEEMIFIQVSEDVDEITIELEGMPANPANHSINIVHEAWTRIGFPCSVAMPFEDALADFEAMDGDLIEGPVGSIEYFEGIGWFSDGEFVEFIPGEGYLFYAANATEDRTLVYSTGAKKARNAKANFGKLVPQIYNSRINDSKSIERNPYRKQK